MSSDQIQDKRIRLFTQSLMNSVQVAAVSIEGVEKLVVIESTVPGFSEGMLTDWGHLQDGVYKKGYSVQIIPAEYI